jgi:hypothetical protein
MAAPPQNLGLGVIAGPVIEIPPRRDPPTVSCKKAHDFLNACRVCCQEEEVDLTDTDKFKFDWKNFLAGRKDRDQVVGVGVVKFIFRRMPWKDPNTNEARTDFIVLRADGTAVRLHPTGHSRNKHSGMNEAIPVYGKYDPNRSPMANIGLPDSLPRAGRGELFFGLRRGPRLGTS